ncbi:ubiquitin-like protein [Legionella israelensis]|uniref:Ubiquitin family protein n=1 Tax=Legionella israelensis TaxID=454 RepID=A0A0W0WM68_9GAMM|nr:ubiquitin-like protein [Legionella israelensis]KTD33426.1 Ubiquitin family protein [Legionella israelensis]QBS09171.1 hypothetical protein E4T55_04455 [Legionella israelensis]SCY29596.1 Ubiquitin family protein [Legionella israelensis DSM 19235]STX58902.1 UV excision repair protein Rad23 [Legionella israelensis]
MQLFIKTLTGKTITLEVDPNSTVLDMKKQIADKESIPVEMQRLILAGRQCEDQRTVREYEFQKYEAIHLVVRNYRPDIDFTTHNFYVAVHNFYSEPGSADNIYRLEGETGQFQYVFDIETMYRKGFTIEEIFQQAIEVRNLRAKKNASHETYQINDYSVHGNAQCSLSIVAIPKGMQIISGQSSSILGTEFAHSESLMRLDDDYNLVNIPYKLIASVQSDGTVYLPRALDQRVETEICRPFRQQVHQYVQAGNFVNQELLKAEFQQALNSVENSDDSIRHLNRIAIYMSHFTYQLISTLDFLEYDENEIAEMENTGVLEALYSHQEIANDLAVEHGIDETTLYAPRAIRNDSRAWAMVMNNIRNAINVDEISDEALKEEVAQFAEEIIQLIIKCYREGMYELTFESLKERYLSKVSQEPVVNDIPEENDSKIIELQTYDWEILDDNQKAEIFAITEELRQNFGGISIQEYWANIDDVMRIEWMEQTHSENNKDIAVDSSELNNLPPEEPIKALVLDFQGTLSGYEYDLHGQWYSQHDILTNNMVEELYNNDMLSRARLNGINIEDSIEKLRALADAGVTIYIATGDGGSYEQGMLSPKEMIEMYGLPIDQHNIISWEHLNSHGIEINHERDLGKNQQLQYIMERDGLAPNQVMFMDDGPGNIAPARRLGITAKQINIPGDFTEGLDMALSKCLNQHMGYILDESSESINPYEQNEDSVSINEQKILWDNLKPEQKQLISSKTQERRHQLGHISTEEYWSGLTIPEQESLLNPKSEQLITDFSSGGYIIELKANLNHYLADLCKYNDITDNSSRLWGSSPAKKKMAVDMLLCALDGENVNISQYEKVYREGTLGDTIRNFVKSGYARPILGDGINSVRDFIRALEQRNQEINYKNTSVYS